jgi:hypothetical protein
MGSNAPALLVLWGLSAGCSRGGPAPARSIDGGTKPRQAGSPFETFDTTAPVVGDAAPAFELADLDGRRVTLAGATARGPVVLVFGSFS